jgi:hypothetical protein
MKNFDSTQWMDSSSRQHTRKQSLDKLNQGDMVFILTGINRRCLAYFDQIIKTHGRIKARVVICGDLLVEVPPEELISFEKEMSRRLP